MSDPKPKTKRRPAAARAARSTVPREDEPANLITAHRQAIRMLLAVIEHDPMLVPEAVTHWVEGGEHVLPGDTSARTLLFASPSAGAFADVVLDVDGDGGDPTSGWGREEWDAVLPNAAWYATYVDCLRGCARARAAATVSVGV
jgi:hypothetical protein